ncbi:arylsulfatase [Stratiformator vulcanicus]|uniref:Arylsulfatase n=1 Tax=Stratiformator vulcanicus TaxID=2527980 RepID=A0A517R0F3_9PLAN|nr:arylsulfatase [Stratiformator vulcanicus]QDT37300.1 Arylsulfatase [Stratiformator vulcanicus]
MFRHSMICLTAAFAVVSLTASSLFAADKPNIIFILADDLGYGDLGCYGQTNFETPRIDEMAGEGMKFTDFYAGSTVCAPSRCVLMTGMHTGHCRIRGNAMYPLEPGDVTIAEVLQDAGYKTGLFGKWGLGEEGSTGVPNKQGFNEFFGYLNQHHAHNYYPTFLYRNQERISVDNVVPDEDSRGGGVASEKNVYSHDLIAENALDFIEQSKDEPFFLYMAVTLPHANNQGGPRGMEVPDLGEFADRDWPEPQKGLAAMIQKLDTDVGRVLDKLAELDIDDETIVLFTSDNGPHNEGGNRSEYFDSNGPLRGLKRALYEGGIRVPMIARWPGKIEAGSVTDHASYFGDFFATAAELSGASVPEDLGLDSVSFAPTLLGESDQPESNYLYWEFYEQGGRKAVRKGKWKAIRQPWDAEKLELYNLREDIGEDHDVAGEHPEIVAEMEGLMKESHVPSPLWKPKGRPNRN